VDDRYGTARYAGGWSPDRRWAVLQHVAHEGPGLIGEALDDAGITFGVVRLDLDEDVPDPRSVDGLVVLGGPMGVHDDDAHPWLGPERDLIARMAAAGRPVLGVCLGAQQLALALGAEVTTGPSAEIGQGHVVLTGAGRRDPVLGPEYTGLGLNALPCVHWHHDTFSLPADAVHLAATRAYPHQAFRWGHHAYGLQFHVEVDARLAAAWQPHLPPGVRLNGPELAQVETTGRRVLHRFVEQAAGAVKASGAVRHLGAER